jgi:hypothetical protein
MSKRPTVVTRFHILARLTAAADRSNASPWNALAAAESFPAQRRVLPRRGLRLRLPA